MAIRKDHVKDAASGNDLGWFALLPNDYTPTKQYDTVVFMHGIGECGVGNLAALNKISKWGPFAETVPKAVDSRKFIAIFPNHLDDLNEKPKVCQFIIKRMQMFYSVKEDSIHFVGHSEGWHVLGNWGFSDPVFAAQVATTVPSSAGPNNVTATFQNIAKFDVRVWGITAKNDAVASTTYVTQLFTKVLAINPKATVIVSQFPATRWPDGKVAHNMTISEMLVQGAGRTIPAGITMGLSTAKAPAMDVYDWMFSNPRGSVAQLPDHAFTGPKYPARPEPEPVVRQIDRIVCTGRALGNVDTEIFYSNGDRIFLRAETGDKNLGTSINFKTRTVALDWQKKPNDSYPWSETVKPKAKKKKTRKKD
jgi:hypothetical protein